MLIVFEGMDGSGKSEQSSRLVQYFNRIGLKAVLLREPGSTPLGENVRELVKFRPNNMQISVCAETLLIFASRAQLVVDIKQYLEDGYIVVLDRWVFSTYVYQCIAKGAPAEDIVNLFYISKASTIVPDLIIYMENSSLVVKRPDDKLEQDTINKRDIMLEAYRNLFKQGHDSKLMGTLFKPYIDCPIAYIDIAGYRIEQTEEKIKALF
ncbi:MAG: dTMP kinase [Pararheinheimera sp.]|nr:dTMP kinase [Rheinheimera sp.]